MEPESHAFWQGNRTFKFKPPILGFYVCFGRDIFVWWYTWGHTQDVPGFVTHHSALHIWYLVHPKCAQKTSKSFLGTTNDGHTSVSTSPLLKRRWLPIYVFLISSLCSCQLLWHVHPVRACSGHMGCIAFFFGRGFWCPSPTPKTFDFARGRQGPANRIL